MNRWFKLFLISTVILVSDQWSKGLIVRHFNLSESIVLIQGFLHFTYIRNSGAAFGVLSTLDPSIRTPFFIIVPTLALLVIFFIYFRLSQRERLLQNSLSLVVGGALGNFVDRIKYGYVVDFIDFHYYFKEASPWHFPAFNIADIAISCGVILLVLDLFLKPTEQLTPER